MLQDRYFFGLIRSAVRRTRNLDKRGSSNACLWIAEPEDGRAHYGHLHRRERSEGFRRGRVGRLPRDRDNLLIVGSRSSPQRRRIPRSPARRSRFGPSRKSTASFNIPVIINRLPFDLESDMAETFFTLADGSPRAVMGIRRNVDGTIQTLDQSVPDGDTAGPQLDGTGSVRFLGIDSPEKSFEQPLGGAQNLDSGEWEQYLTNPFANGLPTQLLEPQLSAHPGPIWLGAPRRTITNTRWPRVSR